MFISKDKSGTVLISSKKPERCTAHWRAINSEYVVMPAKYAEKRFPYIKWENEPFYIEEPLIKSYILVTWPESQNYMDHPRFHECILAESTNVPSASYFVPDDLFTEVTGFSFKFLFPEYV